ncbi:hypothetical protein [Terricaulis sp.]|uniref:hypothetical protein n=1 Tax=Terricaulis sp. TaxID=2768686 RepID=UPI003784BE94
MFLRILGAAGLIGAGVLIGRAFNRANLPAPVIDPKPLPKVRDAGPDTMSAPPKRWDMVDQQADESFPASDPPGNY